MKIDYTYDVAISFAEEDRNAALALALALELAGISKVYYYPEQPSATTGKVLNEKLRKIYSEECRYTVMLLSDYYFRKPIAKLEMAAIIKRLKEQSHLVTVIPVLLRDNINLPKNSILNKLGYKHWNYNPKEIASILVQEFGTKSNPSDKKRGISIWQETNAVFADNQINTAIIKS
jgi:hypothetical protein